MPSRGTHDTLPSVIAYFTVNVEVGRGMGRAESHDAAAGVVVNYLYSNGQVVDTMLDDEHENFIVTVRREFWNAFQGEAERLVQYQRDRLSSGSIRSSEPVFYAPVES